MLFLGTEKYPEEGDYKLFVKKHGGKNNASTSDIVTCYQFDVAPGAAVARLVLRNLLTSRLLGAHVGPVCSVLHLADFLPRFNRPRD